MEATAALKMVKEVFKHQSIQAFVSEMVLDDGASTRALLSHSLHELAKMVVNFEWPVDLNRKKYRNQKMLVSYHHPDHPTIRFLGDLTHRIHCFGKYVFGLENSSLSTWTCILVDAYRLKHNFGYWLLSSHMETFDIFTEKSKVVVEHHFNCHVHCGNWCSMKKVNATKTATGNLKYCCKKDNALLYIQIIQVMGRLFVKPEKLRQCHHGYSSQKNESMNKLISRYTPCRTGHFLNQHC
jgi:hypothetical protein